MILTKPCSPTLPDSGTHSTLSCPVGINERRCISTGTGILNTVCCQLHPPPLTWHLAVPSYQTMIPSMYLLGNFTLQYALHPQQPSIIHHPTSSIHHPSVTDDNLTPCTDLGRRAESNQMTGRLGDWETGSLGVWEGCTRTHEKHHHDHDLAVHSQRLKITK